MDSYSVFELVSYRALCSVSHSPVNSGSLVNNTACCSASSSSLSFTGPLALVVHHLVVHRFLDRLFALRETYFRIVASGNRVEFSRKFVSLSLSTNFRLTPVTFPFSWNFRGITLIQSQFLVDFWQSSFDQFLFRKERKILPSLDRYQRDLSITCHPVRKKRIEPQRHRQVDLPETSLRHGGWHKSRAKLEKRRQDYGSSSLDRIASLYIR